MKLQKWSGWRCLAVGSTHAFILFIFVNAQKNLSSSERALSFVHRLTLARWCWIYSHIINTVFQQQTIPQ